MTKKHFEAVAAAISETLAVTEDQVARNALSDVVRALCIEFKDINARFDAGRFRRACGF